MNQLAQLKNTTEALLKKKEKLLGEVRIIEEKLMKGNDSLQSLKDKKEVISKKLSNHDQTSKDMLAEVKLNVPPLT